MRAPEPETVLRTTPRTLRKPVDMLEALRKRASGWVAKVLIGLLVISFAVWGVADIFTGYRGDDVARVGKTEITVEQYRAALQREIQQVSRQYGSYLTMDQARALGLDGRVLGRLMAEAALDDEARSRGLGLTDEVVADSIRSDPSFQAPGGQFDRSYFEQVLRSAGYSEGLYVAEQRRRLLRQMIADAVGGGVQAPSVLGRAVDRYRNERRSAEYLTVSPAMIDPIAEPTEEDLRNFFEENKPDFRAPEYRRVALLHAAPADLASAIEISEEDIRANFDRDPDRFGAPEVRTIERIVFPSRSAAEEARRAIDEGRGFEEIAADAGVSEQDRVLGALSRREVLDRGIAEAAFSLEVDTISQVVDGTFGPALVRVTSIEEGDQPTFEELRDAIRQEIALDRASDRMLDIYDAIEDDRAAGMTLSEIAQKHGLTYLEFAAVDRQGLTPEGDQVELDDAETVLAEAFRADVGVEADPVEGTFGDWTWFDVLEIIPGRERSFEEARTEVADAWRQDRTEAAVAAKAREIAERIRGGASFFDVAGDIGATPGLVGPINRSQIDGTFGTSAVQLLFTTSQGQVAETVSARSPSRVVFRVTAIDVPTSTGQDEALAANIANGISNDIIDQYLQQLEASLGRSVNQQALRLALGETDEF